jgi:Tfp pilus assembly protein PilN
MSSCVRFGLIVIVIQIGSLISFAQADTATDPLVRVLEAKGILTSAEARSITANASTTEQRDRLAAVLRDKGVISAA